MSYREKIAWLSLIAMAFAYGPYFVLVARGPSPWEPWPHLHPLGLFALVSIVRMLILGAGYLYLRIGSPREERPPLDERDRAIEQRSISAAYYVLIAGMILVGCVMPFSSTGWTIVNAAIFWIVAAEVVHYSVVVASYRLQASS
ncbi:MAG: hypothetical protein ABSB14_11430 [Candidatus Sulfotelmatobacter sp.]|jgi:hypothetical protein